MKNIQVLYLSLMTVVSSAFYSAMAWAAVTAPVGEGLVAALGSDESGSETGIYEITSAITIGLAVVLSIVLTIVGYRIVIMIVRRVGSRTS